MWNARLRGDSPDAVDIGATWNKRVAQGNRTALAGMHPLSNPGYIRYQGLSNTVGFVDELRQVRHRAPAMLFPAGKGHNAIFQGFAEAQSIPDSQAVVEVAALNGRISF